MSSDSDIECDTENEEQEDATSTSEGFNHAFSVQSSSEGRTDCVAHLPKRSCASASELLWYRTLQKQRSLTVL